MSTRNPNDAVNTIRRPRKPTFEETLEHGRKHVAELLADSTKLWEETERRITQIADIPRREWVVWVDERGQISAPMYGRRGEYVTVVEKL